MDCDIDDRDGTVDFNQQDIDDFGVGNEAWWGRNVGPEACSEEQDHGQPLAGHQRPMGVRNKAGWDQGIEEDRGRDDDVDRHQDGETIARVQADDGLMTSDQPRKKTEDDHR